MTQTVLFLCTGNYYRSRFAEIFFNWHAERQSLPWRAESRGLELFPDNFGPMSAHTTARLHRHGIPFAAYERLPLSLSHQDLESAHHVVAVKETEHRPLLARKFPAWLGRIEFWEVHDLDRATPEQSMPHLESEVTRLIERLARSQAAST
ncbi:MAG TPA: low molecular weight phosphatase family protein [Planctomycetaceae bacterium]|jgi:protein-tyrosine phosphatase|nr:low molecular weight phosphatase family protein [Planctomycetaceae bacterium]